MKIQLILWPTALLLGILQCQGQNVKNQTDQHIINQQERMVFKQWDRNKFTPRGGFLNLNPNYWMTWALHPSYPRTDRRPLSGTGMQTQRMALVLAMQNTDEAYKKHADTLKNTAITETVNYEGTVSSADPLWLLYYRQEFSELRDTPDTDLLKGLPPKEQDYMRNRGVYDWYIEERAELRERLEAARSTALDRGNRILAYHRMLEEYRTIKATWETKRRNAALFISLTESGEHMRSGNWKAPDRTDGRSDIQIADDILRNRTNSH